MSKRIRFDGRSRFTAGEGSIPRGSTLTIEEDTKELQAYDYQPFPGILTFEDQVVVWKTSSHSADGGQRSGR